MASLTIPGGLASVLSRADTYRRRGLPWISKGALAATDQALISGSNFLVGIMLARWQAPEQYGAYALGFSILLFLSGFHTALFLEPMSVLGPAAYGNCLTTYTRKLVRLQLWMAVPLSFLVVAAIGVLHHFRGYPGLISALWGVLFATPCVMMFWSCRRAMYLRFAPHLAAGGAFAYCLVVTGLLFLARTFGRLSPLSAFLIQAIAALTAAIWLLASLKSDGGEPLHDSTVIRDHWRYGRWALGTQGVYWLSGNSYYVIVAAFLRMQDAAALRALQNFTLPFTQFLSALGLLVLPWASARFVEEGPSQFARHIRRITLLFMALASAYYTVLCVSGGRVMALLYAGRYSQYGGLLALVGAPVVILGISQGSTIAAQAMQAPVEVFRAYSVSAVLTVMGGVALAKAWGLPGALAGLLASALGYCLMITWRCRKRLATECANDQRCSSFDLSS